MQKRVFIPKNCIKSWNCMMLLEVYYMGVLDICICVLNAQKYNRLGQKCD